MNSLNYSLGYFTWSFNLFESVLVFLFLHLWLYGCYSKCVSVIKCYGPTNKNKCKQVITAVWVSTICYKFIIKSSVIMSLVCWRIWSFFAHFFYWQFSEWEDLLWKLASTYSSVRGFNLWAEILMLFGLVCKADSGLIFQKLKYIHVHLLSVSQMESMAAVYWHCNLIYHKVRHLEKL